MKRWKWVLAIAAVTAIGLMAARQAWSAEDGPKSPPRHEQAQPADPPRDAEFGPPHRPGPEGPRRPDEPCPPGPSFGRGPGAWGPQGPQMHPGGTPGMMPGMMGGMRGMRGMPGMQGMMPGGMPGGMPGMGPAGMGPGGMMPGRGPDFEAMRRNDPEMFKLLREDNELDRRTHELGMEFRHAPPDERDHIQKEIHELVNRQFEVRQQRRALELKRLKGELKRLDEAIERRNKARDQIIERRVSELLGREEDLSF